MKFLCEHCHTRYQIADEKVAGKTLRMKCRKCGEPIVVHPDSMPPSALESEDIDNQLVSEAGKSTFPPPRNSVAPPRPAPAPAPKPAAPAPAAKPAAPAPKPATPIAAPKPALAAKTKSDAQTAPAAKAAPKPAPAPVSAIAAPKVGAAKTEPAAHMSSSISNDITRPVAQAAPRVIKADSPMNAPKPAAAKTEFAKPSPAAKGEGPKRDVPHFGASAVAAPKPASPLSPGGKEPSAPKPAAASALTHAFERAIVEKPEPAKLDPKVPADGWFVSLNQQPTGPMSLKDLQGHFDRKEISPSTFVWREGYDEWVALSSVPELAYELNSHKPASAASFTPLFPQQSPAIVAAKPAAASSSIDRLVNPEHTPSLESLVKNAPVAPKEAAAIRAPAADRAADREPPPAAEPPAKRDPLHAIVPPAVKITEVPSVLAKQDVIAHGDPFAHLPPASSSSPHPVSKDDRSRLSRLSMMLRPKGISRSVAFLIAAAALLIGVVITAVVVHRATMVVYVPGSTSIVYIKDNSTAPPAGFVPLTGPSASTSTSGNKNVGNNTYGQQSSKSSMSSTSASAGSTSPSDTASSGPAACKDLSQAEVNAVSSRYGRQVRSRCYDMYASNGPASVQLSLSIDATGAVSDSKILQNSGTNAVATCALALSKTVHFTTSCAGGTFGMAFVYAAE